ALEALCSLDAGRFRLPLVDAVRRLLPPSVNGTLLIDAPGVVRGVAGAELLSALLEASGADLVLGLARAGARPPLLEELDAAGVEVLWMTAADGARRPGKRQRQRARTRRWDAWLGDAETRLLDPAGLALLGTPPPRDVAHAWRGRQVALLERGRTLTLGEVLALEDDGLRLRAPPWQGRPDALLVRDARRGPGGELASARPFAADSLAWLPPPDVRPGAVREPDTGPRPVARVGQADAALVNGVFGDPLLHLRLRHQRRSLLFDLGMPERLAARIAHQVSDVFLSHAHLDHIGGFLWLLRSRMGDFPPCRLYGPPGLARHVQGLLDGIDWDRIGDQGPCFEVVELHDEQLRRFHLQAGRTRPQPLPGRAAPAGVLLEEAAFRVRAATLDHGIPVLAYAFEPPLEIAIRKERLAAHGWPPGPWLGELKRRLLADDHGAVIELPDGGRRSAGELADDIALIRPGRKLTYATDLADTADNRRRLVELARGSHTFFCEATFREADADRARRTGHLTTRACGEIASAADVVQLVPFHFSRRYDADPAPLYAEIASVCSRLAPLPKAPGQAP
ncbi:MAG TPA: MBL fold metallo-hydrolase, partial [Gammaproteobacteria bacterium]|nr:MBL fold metallo-hydrolase [Gammaproteobacteria bacterium]